MDIQEDVLKQLDENQSFKGDVWPGDVNFGSHSWYLKSWDWEWYEQGEESWYTLKVRWGREGEIGTDSKGMLKEME